MSETQIEVLTIDGVKYLRADQVPSPAPIGNRHILVADRGWIFCGDLEREDGRIILTRAVHVRSWSSIGFDGLIESGGRGSNVVVRELAQPVDLPEDAELFAYPSRERLGLVMPRALMRPVGNGYGDGYGNGYGTPTHNTRRRRG